MYKIDVLPIGVDSRNSKIADVFSLLLKHLGLNKCLFASTSFVLRTIPFSLYLTDTLLFVSIFLFFTNIHIPLLSGGVTGNHHVININLILKSSF